MSVQVTVNRAAIEHLLSDPNGPIGVKVRSVAIRVRNTARKICPKSSGRLANSIQEKPGARKGRRVISYTVGTRVRYAKYVHNGTIYMRARPFLKDAIALERGRS